MGYELSIDRIENDKPPVTVWVLCGRQHSCIGAKFNELCSGACANSHCTFNIRKAVAAIKALSYSRESRGVKEEVIQLLSTLIKEWELHPNATFVFYESY